MYNYIITEQGVFPIDWTEGTDKLLEARDFILLSSNADKRREFLAKLNVTSLIVSSMGTLIEEEDQFVKRGTEVDYDL